MYKHYVQVCTSVYIKTSSTSPPHTHVPCCTLSIGEWCGRCPQGVNLLGSRAKLAAEHLLVTTWPVASPPPRGCSCAKTGFYSRVLGSNPVNKRKAAIAARWRRPDGMEVLVLTPEGGRLQFEAIGWQFFVQTFLYANFLNF